MNPNLLTLNDVCAELDIGKSTAYKMIKNNIIPYGRIGRKIIIKKQDLQTYIDTLIDKK